jgi:hypothetical protein
MYLVQALELWIGEERVDTRLLLAVGSGGTEPPSLMIIL